MACLAGKQRRTPFRQQAKFRAKGPIELVHTDLCSAITPGERRYFLLLIDDYSRYMWLVLLATKDEAATALKRFQEVVKTEAKCKLRTNRCGEFTFNALAAHFADTSVKRHLMASYSPQQNRTGGRAPQLDSGRHGQEHAERQEGDKDTRGESKSALPPSPD
jgi:hypothetical protein